MNGVRVCRDTRVNVFAEFAARNANCAVGGDGFAVLACDCRAVAKRPDAREIPNRQHGIDDDGAAFVTLYRKSFEDRVRGCTRRPHECLRGNLFIFLMAALCRACIVSCFGLAALRFARSAFLMAALYRACIRSAHRFQHDRAGPGIGQARIELEDNPSFPHTLQCVRRQLLTQFWKNPLT